MGASDGGGGGGEGGRGEVDGEQYFILCIHIIITCNKYIYKLKYNL